MNRRSLSGWMSFVLGVVILAQLALPAACAEGAVLKGTVVDSLGHPGSGAGVSLPELKAGVTADSAGHFRFKSVLPGRYTIGVALVNCRSWEEQLVTVATDSATDVRLVVGCSPPWKWRELDMPAESISVGFTEHYGRYGASESWTFRGDGRGSFMAGPASNPAWRSATFTFPPAAFDTLLQHFYDIDFFRLSGGWSPSWIQRSPNGRINSGQGVIADAGSCVLSVQLGGFTKSLDFVNEGGWCPPYIWGLYRELRECSTRFGAKALAKH
jgi:hypothetical protein